MGLVLIAHTYTATSTHVQLKNLDFTTNTYINALRENVVYIEVLGNFALKYSFIIGWIQLPLTQYGELLVAFPFIAMLVVHENRPKGMDDEMSNIKESAVIKPMTSPC